MNTRNRGWIPVILSLPSAQDYLDDRHSLGAMVGRVAGRISHGRYQYQDQWVQLQRNEGVHHLHGGDSGFGQVLWESTASLNTIRFTLSSEDGDHGYPGNMTVMSTIKINGSDLIYRTEAVCDQPTPFNPTQHNYYNLGGAATIMSHRLFVKSGRRLELDSERLPTGRYVDVNETEFDLRTARQLSLIQSRRDPQMNAFGGLDHYYVADNGVGCQQEAQSPVAELSTSNYRMQVFTNQPGVQIYTGNALNRPYQGICIEAQHFPDAPNHQHFPSIILKPEYTGLNETRYRFLEND